MNCFQIKYKDVVERVVNVQRNSDSGGQFLTVELLTRGTSVGDEMRARITATEPMDLVHYVVIGRGDILVAKTIEVHILSDLKDWYRLFLTFVLKLIFTSYSTSAKSSSAKPGHLSGSDPGHDPRLRGTGLVPTARLHQYHASCRTLCTSTATAASSSELKLLDISSYYRHRYRQH